MTDIQLNALSYVYQTSASLSDTHYCDVEYLDRVHEQDEAYELAFASGLTEQQIDNYITEVESL